MASRPRRPNALPLLIAVTIILSSYTLVLLRTPRGATPRRQDDISITAIPVAMACAKK